MSFLGRELVLWLKPQLEVGFLAPIFDLFKKPSKGMGIWPDGLTAHMLSQCVWVGCLVLAVLYRFWETVMLVRIDFLSPTLETWILLKAVHLESESVDGSSVSVSTSQVNTLNYHKR